MQRHAGFLLSLGLVFVTLYSSNGQDCNLKCKNGAKCVLGVANFTNLFLDDSMTFAMANESIIGGKHCACEPGWTGTYCDIIYESCGTGRSCLNGGSCVDGLYDEFGNDQFFCDCTNATDPEGNPFVGKYCEKAYINNCGEDGDNIFCVNGGECDPDYPLQSGTPCQCPPAYEGIHCEFEKGSVPDCDLECMNNGTCVLGILSPEEAQGRYNFAADDDDQYKRCVCPKHYEGMHCEIRKVPCGDNSCFNGGVCKKDKTCDCSHAKDTDGVPFQGEFCQTKATTVVKNTENTTSQVTCGNYFCFNGGTCVKAQINGETERVCDCSTAQRNGFTYVGQYCQYLSTDCNTNCQKETDTVRCGDKFCFNGGTCRSDNTCSCTTGFEGSYCEYKKASNCNLDCKNDGVCIQGSLTDANADDMFNFWNMSTRYDHCLCRDGWGGTECEIKEVACGDHQCQNGGTCVQTTMDGTTKFHCDCSSTVTETTAYAGRSCEHKATAICSNSSTSQGTIFCVNGGTCREEGYQGCACPDGFAGFSCEFTKATKKEASPVTTPTAPTPTTTTTTATPPSTTPSQPVVDALGSTGIDMCTIGNVPLGQPRFFCINGGGCKAHVTAGNPFPGCDCLPGFDGPHCEWKVTVIDSKQQVTLHAAIVIVALIGVACLVALLIRFIRRRKKLTINPEERRRFMEETNLAPRRESHIDPFPVKPLPAMSSSSSSSSPMASRGTSEVTSSSDPIATALVSLPGAPEVYIGPPRDEDGHELHNVEII